MNKQTATWGFLIVVVIIIVFVVYTTRKEKPATDTSTIVTPIVVESPTVGSVPDVNPASRANPLKSVKTNPFE